MLKILEKIGRNKKVMEILEMYGWSGDYATFAMQKTRGKLTADVSLILWDYCQKNNIPVSLEDFKG
jgi:hypothetical protein